MQNKLRFGRITNTLIYLILVSGVAVIVFLYWKEVKHQGEVSSELISSLSGEEVVLEGRKEKKPVIQKKEIPIVRKEETKIGFVTDAHCYMSKDDLVVDGWKLNWRCREPLEDFAKKMNEEFKPDFVVEGGDFVDGKDKMEREAFLGAQEIFETVQAQKYYALGNHEMKQLSVDDWLGLTGHERSYYFFDMKGYRFVILDGNNRPTLDGGVEHTKSGSLYYPGLIDDDQMVWLKETLQNGVESGLTSVVFVHQPPVGIDSRDITQLFIKGIELQELFTKNKVRAVFSGHIERFCNMEVGGVDYYVLKGFWKGNRRVIEEYEFRNAGIFTEITLKEDTTIDVNVYHRTREERTYNLMEINEDSANCLDGAMLEKDEEELAVDGGVYTEE